MKPGSYPSEQAINQQLSQFQEIIRTKEDPEKVNSLWKQLSTRLGKRKKRELFPLLVGHGHASILLEISQLFYPRILKLLTRLKKGQKVLSPRKAFSTLLEALHSNDNSAELTELQSIIQQYQFAFRTAITKADPKTVTEAWKNLTTLLSVKEKVTFLPLLIRYKHREIALDIIRILLTRISELYASFYQENIPLILEAGIPKFSAADPSEKNKADLTELQIIFKQYQMAFLVAIQTQQYKLVTILAETLGVEAIKHIIATALTEAIYAGEPHVVAFLCDPQFSSLLESGEIYDLILEMITLDNKSIVNFLANTFAHRLTLEHYVSLYNACNRLKRESFQPFLLDYCQKKAEPPIILSLSGSRDLTYQYSRLRSQPFTASLENENSPSPKVKHKKPKGYEAI